MEGEESEEDRRQGKRVRGAHGDGDARAKKSRS